jgi:hypothetical protein
MVMNGVNGHYDCTNPIEGEGDTPPLLSHKRLLSNASPYLKAMCDNAVNNRVVIITN